MINVMKLANYKSIFFRRRFAFYVMLFLACLMINYGFVSNFLQVSFARLWSVDRVVKHSKVVEKSLRYNNNNRAVFRNTFYKKTPFMKTHIPDVIGHAGDPIEDIAMSSDATLEPAAIVQTENLGSEGKAIGSSLDTISSDILNTMVNISGDFPEHCYRTCNSTAVIGNSCETDHCLQLQLPGNLRTRVEQLVTPTQLQIGYDMRQLLKTMADKVPGYYDFILVSGVSYTHFREAQAMLYNIHTNLFPYLTNFTFIYYNLGLSDKQRTFMAKTCRCHLIDFPFELLPEFFRFLKCYAWKPLIVNAHITRANLLFWIDASVRFKNDSLKTIELLNRARSRGIQLFKSKQSIAHVTLPSMFHYFGDEACVYANYSVILSGIVLIRNVQFVRRAILEPWAACAINPSCMCPKSVDLHLVRISCHNDKGLYHYGVCHRFDQSALSLIVVKIYQERISHIFAPMKDYLDVKRGDEMDYPRGLV